MVVCSPDVLAVTSERVGTFWWRWCGAGAGARAGPSGGAPTRGNKVCPPLSLGYFESFAPAGRAELASAEQRAGID